MRRRYKKLQKQLFLQKLKFSEMNKKADLFDFVIQYFQKEYACCRN
jgi:hypothetical protein